MSLTTTRRFSRTRFRELRLTAEVSLPQLAVALHKSWYTVDSYERGRVVPPTYMLPTLALVFGCRIDDFFAEVE